MLRSDSETASCMTSVCVAVRLVVSDETVNPHETSLHRTFTSSSAVSTNVSSADVMSCGYLASSSGDTSGMQCDHVASSVIYLSCRS